MKNNYKRKQKGNWLKEKENEKESSLINMFLIEINLRI